VQTKVPVRWHTPVPTEQALPTFAVQIPPQLAVPAGHTQVPDPLHTPLVGVGQAVPNGRLAVAMHTTLAPEQPVTPVWHALGLHTVAAMSSTTPLQLSSMPLHVSTPGAPAVAEHVVPVPLHTTTPLRAQAPTPTEQNVPVGRQTPLQLVCPAGHTQFPKPSHTPPITPGHACPAGEFPVRAQAVMPAMQ
jgi:hypothetical protein